MKAPWRFAPLAAVLWLSCSTTSTTGDDEPEPEPPPTAGLFAYAYTLAGDSLLTLQVDTVYCVDTMLTRDTLTMTARVELSADSLTLTFPDNFGANAVVRSVVRCVRLDTGSALQGHWRVVADEHAVVSGTLTGAEARAWADDTLIADSMIAQQGYELEFTVSWMAGTFQGALGRVVLPCLTAGVPAECRVTVTASGSTVQFSGLLSGEVVTVTIDEHLNRRYTSSRASRVPYTVWERPESCARQTAWFADFVSDNMPFADEFMQSQTVTFVVGVGAVDVTRVDDSTVELRGRTTLDVVTVSCDSVGVVTFSGTGTGQDAWTTARGSELTPTWWDLFVQDNLL